MNSFSLIAFLRLPSTTSRVNVKASSRPCKDDEKFHHEIDARHVNGQ